MMGGTQRLQEYTSTSLLSKHLLGITMALPGDGHREL
ncbi:rCG29647 [Rattus norvegicus]|uniref:RCG29647 n=1 Tax=Rattus norvegicus TaxID=10116 RepID=A6IML1_RAT|nr:rCG29647 [Rattus norvegicus]